MGEKEANREAKIKETLKKGDELFSRHVIGSVILYLAENNQTETAQMVYDFLQDIPKDLKLEKHRVTAALRVLQTVLNKPPTA